MAACTRQPRFPDFLCACNLFQLGDAPVDVSSVSSLRLLTGQKVCLFFICYVYPWSGSVLGPIDSTLFLNLDTPFLSQGDIHREVRPILFLAAYQGSPGSGKDYDGCNGPVPVRGRKNTQAGVSAWRLVPAVVGPPWWRLAFHRVVGGTLNCQVCHSVKDIDLGLVR